MGDSEVDVDNLVLKEEQMPNSVIHNHVDKSTFCGLVKGSRVKLEKGVVLGAICVGFEEPTEPVVCLSGEHIQDPLVGVATFTEHGLTLGDVIHSVGGYVNAPWLMVCSSNEMATATVKVRLLYM
ncbi:hypothetical protein Patl1_26205 [Pistacia atlantica]|uniref:Uncharacterized protein n=1 Tax=Pistacia atlantica TaxID=434234 RepID=A0ACC1B227_9ROSI|nr:hypothetical protein Patl1_26205 [Pistacia atlantica]